MLPLKRRVATHVVLWQLYRDKIFSLLLLLSGRCIDCPHDIIKNTIGYIELEYIDPGLT